MSDVQTARRNDLLRTRATLWLLCLPGCVAIAAAILGNGQVFSFAVTHALWIAATAWISVGCYLNARVCGRVHCRIDGVLFPLLSVAGLLDLIGVLRFSWNAYWIIFGVILAAGFLVELVWQSYA